VLPGLVQRLRRRLLFIEGAVRRGAAARSGGGAENWAVEPSARSPAPAQRS